jgi:hypothetical protein
MKGHNSRIEKLVNSELDCIIPYLSTIIIYPLNDTSIPVFFNTSKTSSDDIEEVTFTVFVPTSVTTSVIKFVSDCGRSVVSPRYSGFLHQ